MSQRFPEDDAVKQDRALRQEHRDKLKAHRGMATWGENLVPLGEFRNAAQEYGRHLNAKEREAEKASYVLGGPNKHFWTTGSHLLDHYSEQGLS